MKKAAITLAVLLSLSLCLMVSASAIIGGTATEVSFTQENVVGDPASAEGFSVQSLFTLKGHAHWDTTLTLGENPPGIQISAIPLFQKWKAILWNALRGFIQLQTLAYIPTAR